MEKVTFEQNLKNRARYSPPTIQGTSSKAEGRQQDKNVEKMRKTFFNKDHSANLNGM